MKALHFVLLMLTSAASLRSVGAEPIPLDKTAPLIYSISVESEAASSWSLGLVAGLVGEAYRQAHAKYLDAARSISEDGQRQHVFLKAFSCIDFEDAAAPCRRTLQVRPGTSDQELASILGDEPTHSARLINLFVVFDGRFLHFTGQASDLRLVNQGVVDRGHSVLVAFVNSYSRQLHQDDIRSGRNNAPFEGRFGSKEALMHFWLGGSSPRLVGELAQAPSLIAELVAATRDPRAKGILAGDMSGLSELPRLRELTKTQSKPCKTIHGDLRVLRDLGEYVWLAGPKQSNIPADRFFIEPKCGFDF